MTSDLPARQPDPMCVGVSLGDDLSATDSPTSWSRPGPTPMQLACSQTATTPSQGPPRVSQAGNFRASRRPSALNSLSE